ncbi:hypothetical protein HA466_0030330 [Hirschfeldia incana]|nr:hypothetical protein HA466_0030330 [Hirschfeldia incana]
MGTAGKTFNAHVISATYHHKHVRLVAGDASDLRRGIGEILSRWGGLQMAVKNKWGGHDSLEKSQELAHHLFHLLSHPSNVITVDEIESFLHESLLLSFSTEMEDGSTEEVAEQLMILHEENCLHGSH